MIAPGVSAALDGSGLRLVQVAYATTDVRAAARRWHDLTGAGPFFVRDHVPIREVVGAGGEVAVFDHTCALGQWGEVMVEFVHHHELAPPALDSVMRRGGTGIHHVACLVDDLEVARERLLAGGAELVMDARTPEVHFLFFDLGPEMDHLLEVYEASPYLVELYARVREASVGWDGTDLLRERS